MEKKIFYYEELKREIARLKKEINAIVLNNDKLIKERDKLKGMIEEKDSHIIELMEIKDKLKREREKIFDEVLGLNFRSQWDFGKCVKIRQKYLGSQAEAEDE